MVPKNFLDLLGLHKDCTASLLEKASGLCANDLDISTDLEVIKIRRMIAAVFNEFHYMRGFVRLKPVGDNVLYGYMKPQHDVGPRVSEAFARRFPTTIIVLGNNTRSWISLYDGKRVLNEEGGSLAGVLEELKARMGGEEDETGEELWETYYWSQYCDERRNIRYFNQNMPKKYRKSAGLKVENNTSRAKRIDDFC